MTKRNLFALCGLLLIVPSLLFAQAEPKKVLDAKVVEAFIKNNKTLQADIDAAGEKFASIFDKADVDMANPASMIGAIRSVSVPAEIQAVFSKNGFGKNGFEKFMVISYAVSILYMSEMMDSEMQGYAEMPEMKEYFDEAKKSIKEMRAAINAKDFSLIESRKKELFTIFVEDN